MLKNIFKIDKKYWKKYVLYLLLLISNIALFLGLINYNINIGINIDFHTFEDISAVIATIIILGLISSKTPKIKNRGESSLYGMGYLIIICIIGLMTSYFNGKFNISSFFEPYLEMFKVLCAVLIFILLATNIKSFKEIINGEHTRRNKLVCMIIFMIIGLFASYVYININDTPANIRCLVVMLSGLFGGPFVGIPVAIVAGAYRFSLGGITAVPCAISTVISGIIGSLIFIWNDKKFPGTLEAIILMFLFTGFEMLLVVLMTPPDISFPFVQNIYPIMTFASVTGMLIYSIVLKEAKAKMTPQPSPHEHRMNKFEEELKKHSTINESLRNEIESLKDEIKKLKEK